MDTEQATPLPNVGTTPEGILVGADVPEQSSQIEQPEAPPQPEAQTPPAEEAKFTEADMVKARQEEKNKLYARIEAMKSDVDRLKEARERQFAEEADLKAKQEREEQEMAEKEMDVRELLAKKESEWEEKLRRMEEDRERDRALLDQERQYAELTAYQARRIEESRDDIMPELIDLVSGNTPEEIDASIESLKQRSEMIFNSAQDAISSAQRDSSGSRVTLPPAVENPSENVGVTPEAIRNMSLQEYAKHRQNLLSDPAQGRSQGMFG